MILINNEISKTYKALSFGRCENDISLMVIILLLFKNNFCKDAKFLNVSSFIESKLLNDISLKKLINKLCNLIIKHIQSC